MNRILICIACALAALSPFGTPAPASGDDCIVLENFSKAVVGEFPAGWKVRKETGRQAYVVNEDAGVRFLRARTEKLGIQAAHQVEWNLDEYPMLAWRWRPVTFPVGADERTSRNDSVLAVYLLVPYSTVRGPQAVKYVWSDVVPVGTQLESNLGLTKVRVLRSGREKTDWTDEKVDVRADFLAAFGVSKAPTPAGIAVLTDSDDTGSTATGDYAEFRACRR